MINPAGNNNFWFIAALLIAFSGCSSKPVQVETEIEIKPVVKGAPEWVNFGSNISGNKDERQFQGVGFALVVGDMAMQKATADDMARAEVARLLSSCIRIISTDLLASNRLAENGDKNMGQSEADISLQIKNIIKSSMASTRIIKSWRDPNSNAIWSLAVLDMKKVVDTTTGISDVNVGLKRYIEKDACNDIDKIVKEKTK